MSARRVAIVTGASSGIGRALAERAVRAGWDVFAVGRRADRLADLQRLVSAATGTLATLALDLREPGAAARIVRETLAAYGRIDVLVNNAGGVAVGPVCEQSDDALREQMETHVIVPLALAREALPSLRASRGLLIFFGSGVARIPVGTLGAYPAAKAAVRSLARTARNDLRPAGVAVTYVDPGAVATEFMTRVGFAGPPPAIAASPYDVARAVFAAFTSRRAVVNAVPWQTFFVALGEAFPRVTDYLLTRAPSIVGGETRALPTTPAPAPAPAPASTAAPAVTGGAEAESDAALRSATEAGPEAEATRASFAEALAPHEHRMQKLKLRSEFVRELLQPGSELESGAVALRWAGMPNKNERGLTNEVLGALVDAGFLERIAGAGERFRVLRPAER
ncbi:MAG: hypothetical protein NVS2B3_00020 [Vulcanimicrobiaceae bacterium]